MATLDALDCEIGGIPSNAAAVFGSIAMNGDEYVRCNRCGFGGCDVRVSGCGCTMHAVSTIVIFRKPFSLGSKQGFGSTAAVESLRFH
jgi:hypothetical protein